MTTVKEISYGGWSKCIQVSNGTVDLVITSEVGPRIIRYGFNDSANLFCEVEDMMGKTGGDDWRIYGGHRFWHAPEHPVRTYYPDNAPVDIQEQDGFVRVTQPTEPTTGIQKAIDIHMDNAGTHVRVVHRLHNHGLWPVHLAPWALSVMATGGTAVIPHPPRGSHPDGLLPANSLTLWPYTNMADARWTWGEKFILLRQDTNATNPQKVGIDVRDNWSAYVNGGFMFLKRFEKVAGAAYPDNGCTVETFTNDWMLELETLGPLVNLEPGSSVEHTEHWYLFHDVQPPSNDGDVEKAVLPHI